MAYLMDKQRHIAALTLWDIWFVADDNGERSKNKWKMFNAVLGAFTGSAKSLLVIPRNIILPSLLTGSFRDLQTVYVFIDSVFISV